MDDPNYNPYMKRLNARGDYLPEVYSSPPVVDIGLDCAVIPLQHQGLVMVQTTDFFYPLVDNPYLQGKIACSNVLSDLYSMGVPYCDNILMLLGIPTKMSNDERSIVIKMMMRGFKVSELQM